MSEEKKKKKRNPDGIIEPPLPPITPELLEWYTDPEAGYFSPIVPELPGSVIAKGRALTAETAKKDVAEIMGVEIPKEEEKVYGDTPEELADHYEIKSEKALADTVVGGLLLAVTSAAASIPFVYTGSALDEVWRLPPVRAMVETSSQTMMAYYNNVQSALMRRHLFATHKPLIPESYRLALGASKGILASDVYIRAMAESGLSEKWADMWVEESYISPPLEALLALLRREVITDKEFDVLLNRTPYKEDVRTALINLKDVIPPLSDLITMAVKEAFGTHVPEEQYPEYVEWAKKMGLSEYFAGAYWYAHWDRIALAQMYDNLYRDFWDKDKFMAMLRIKDVHPDDREAIFNVAYNPPSLREMGYGWDTGIYKEADIEKYRKWGGLSPSDAKLSARSMVAYRTEAEREAVRREHLHLFAVGRETEEEYKKNLERLITAEEAIELWVERGKLEAERRLKPATDIEYRIVTSSEAKWMFTYGLREEPWYREKLEALDWDKERIDVAVERAKEEIKPEVVVPEEVEYRDLTVTQIRDLWRIGEIKAEEMPAFLEAINYSPKDAERIASIITYVPPVVEEIRPYTDAWSRRLYAYRLLDLPELLTNYLDLGYDEEHARNMALSTILAEEVPILEAGYSKGWFNGETILLDLLDMQVDREDAVRLRDRIIRDYRWERLSRERDLTKLEIIKGVKQQKITPKEAVILLTDLGYMEWEAIYILDISLVVGAGDPEGYWEMKRVTEAYKKATGQKSKDVPAELLEWERKYKEIKAEVDKARAEGIPNIELSNLLIKLNEAEANYRRAIQEWERVS